MVTTDGVVPNTDRAMRLQLKVWLLIEIEL